VKNVGKVVAKKGKQCAGEGNEERAKQPEKCEDIRE